MISKQQQKYVQSLHNKKYRTEFKQFLVEGEKGILELFSSEFEIVTIFCSESLKSKIINFKNTVVCSIEEINSISTLKTNSIGVAIVNQKAETNYIPTENDITLLLDGINDPGNLGTIIRLADWYGLKTIICSKNTVEFYNPKVISATMGSFCRINLIYKDLKEVLIDKNIMSYGAFLEGENIHHIAIEKPAYLIIGSESHGISTEIEHLINHKITIPKFGLAESLNAAVATGIILDNVFKIK